MEQRVVITTSTLTTRRHAGPPHVLSYIPIINEDYTFSSKECNVGSKNNFTSLFRIVFLESLLAGFPDYFKNLLETKYKKVTRSFVTKTGDHNEDNEEKEEGKEIFAWILETVIV